MFLISVIHFLIDVRDRALLTIFQTSYFFAQSSSMNRIMSSGNSSLKYFDKYKPIRVIFLSSLIEEGLWSTPPNLCVAAVYNMPRLIYVVLNYFLDHDTVWCDFLWSCFWLLGHATLTKHLHYQHDQQCHIREKEWWDDVCQ